MDWNANHVVRRGSPADRGFTPQRPPRNPRVHNRGPHKVEYRQPWWHTPPDDEQEED